MCHPQYNNIVLYCKIIFFMQMKPALKRRLTRYFIVFILVMAVNGAVRRIVPYEEWKDLNLLVNAVESLLVTLLFVLADSAIRCLRKRS